jgi:hypothetical protein
MRLCFRNSEGRFAQSFVFSSTVKESGGHIKCSCWNGREREMTVLQSIELIQFSFMLM